MKQRRLKVAVIGGGWSGLYALKYALEAGFDATLYERTDHIGGVWQYREYEQGGVWKSAHATSSKTYLHASDFPMPDNYPLFPHHSEVLTFLHKYIEHFELWPHIRLNHTVQQVEKKGKRWLVAVSNSAEQATLIQWFDAVFICTGQTDKPSYPSEQMYRSFSGSIMHAADYKYPTNEMHGKNILVIGGGESASDIANEVSHVAKHVYMSVRRGQWFVERHNGAQLAADVRFSRRNRWFATNYGNNPVVRLFEIISAVSFGEGGHGIEAWQPEVPLLNGFINKSRKVLDKIALGMVTPKGAVTAVDERCITFKNDSQPIEIDMIIYATGYKKRFPFPITPCPDPLYKHVFYPDAPSLVVIGHVRPVFGSIVGLSELQARWATAVLAGTVTLPSTKKMNEIVKQDKVRNRTLFPADHERLPHLVSHFEYADFILKELKAEQSFLRLFFTNYQKWKLLLKAPWTPFEVLLNDQDSGDVALDLIKHEYDSRRKVKGPSLFKFMVYILILSTMVMLTAVFLSTYSLWQAMF